VAQGSHFRKVLADVGATAGWSGGSDPPAELVGSPQRFLAVLDAEGG
jgi:hypothetical protein